MKYVLWFQVRYTDSYLNTESSKLYSYTQKTNPANNTYNFSLTVHTFPVIRHFVCNPGNLRDCDRHTGIRSGNWKDP